MENAHPDHSMQGGGEYAKNFFEKFEKSAGQIGGVRGIVIKHLRERSARDAGVAELADAWDLKSHGSNPVPVRPRSPAPYRGVEQLVARRAHNPEAAGSSPVSATIKRPVFVGKWDVFFTYKEKL